MKRTHCVVCEGKTRLEEHHLVPVARGGTRGFHGRKLVTLCHQCHVRAHQKFGPGDKYKGPRTLIGFLIQMRDCQP